MVHRLGGRCGGCAAEGTFRRQVPGDVAGGQFVVHNHKVPCKGQDDKVLLVVHSGQVRHKGALSKLHKPKGAQTQRCTNPKVHKSKGAHSKCSSWCIVIRCTAKEHYPMVHKSNGAQIQW